MRFKIIVEHVLCLVWLQVYMLFVNMIGENFKILIQYTLLNLAFILIFYELNNNDIKNVFYCIKKMLCIILYYDSITYHY